MSNKVLLVAISAITSLPLLAATPASGKIQQPDEWFQSEDGKHVLDCILSWQTEHGDWPRKDTTKKLFAGDRTTLKGTFKNGASTGELRILARAARLTDDDRYKQAFAKGLDHILRAQYDSGGWPQRYPSKNDYCRHIAFKNKCMVRVMELLSDVVVGDDFAFLDEKRRASAQQAFQKGIDCILDCQVIVKNERTVWCTQYDVKTLKPVRDRAHDLVSLSGPESASVLVFLMQLDDPSLEVISAVRSGVNWFHSTKIEGHLYNRSIDKPALTKDKSSQPLWAKFYEIETNRPIFFDEDGIKYNINQIDAEIRGGYAWYGKWGNRLLQEAAKWSHP